MLYDPNRSMFWPRKITSQKRTAAATLLADGRVLPFANRATIYDPLADAFGRL
jgi:hypothetical protein